MALKGTKKGTVTQNSAYYEYWLSWSAVQNTEENYSDVTVTHYWKQIRAKTFNTVGSRDYGITIDDGTGSKDCTKSGSKVFNYHPWPTNAKISSYTKRVKHNDNGKKSITISTWANGHANSYGPSSTTSDSGDCKASVTVELDDIPREALFLSATNFNDEENPTITYKNAAGDAVETLQACISLDGSRDDIEYRDIPKNGTSYTFPLTEAERKLLRQNCTGPSRYVTFYLKTKINGVSYVSDLVRILTIVNANPTLAPVVYDTNELTTALTGNNQILIKYYSNAHYVVNASAKKEATISDSDIDVTHNGKTVHASYGTWQKVEDNTFIFNVTDSRGNSAIESGVILQMINYTKLTCNISNNKPSLNGTMKVECSGNYFNGGFGTTPNSLTVQYRYKVQNGSYSSWQNMTTSIDDQSYTASANITIANFNPASVYTFQTRAIDKINTSGVNSIEKNVKYVSVYDWGENDFNFSVPVTLNYKPLHTVGDTYVTESSTEDPSTLFGGTWERVRTFYGGELVGFASVVASGGTQITSGTATGFGADPVGTKTHTVVNYVDGVLMKGYGAVRVQTKGIVGMVEAVMTISGLGGAGLVGLWFRNNNNALPAGVTILPYDGVCGLMTGPQGANYGGATHSYIYYVTTDEDINFGVNPRFSPYQGAFTPSIADTKCSLLVKAYAKPKTSYMWRKISD